MGRRDGLEEGAADTVGLELGAEDNVGEAETLGAFDTDGAAEGAAGCTSMAEI